MQLNTVIANNKRAGPLIYIPVPVCALLPARVCAGHGPSPTIPSFCTHRFPCMSPWCANPCRPLSCPGSGCLRLCSCSRLPALLPDKCSLQLIVASMLPAARRLARRGSPQVHHDECAASGQGCLSPLPHCLRGLHSFDIGGLISSCLRMRSWEYGVWIAAMCLQACAMRAGAPNSPPGPGSCVSASSCSPAHAPWAFVRSLGLRGGGERAHVVDDANGQSEAEGMPALQEIIYVAPKRKWQR